MLIVDRPLLVAKECTLVGRGQSPLRRVSFLLPHGVCGAVIGPPTLRALFFDGVVGERRPVEGSLVFARPTTPLAKPAVRLDARELASLAGHITLNEQVGLWMWRLHNRIHRRGDPSIPASAYGSAPLLGLDDAELVRLWMHCAVTGESELLILDVPIVLQRAAGSLLSLVNSFCTRRSRSVLLGFDSDDEVPSRISWRYSLATG